MKARELGEEKAKERIDKLNELMQKWEVHDKKAQKYFQRQERERQMKADKLRRKAEEAKQKVHLDLREIEYIGYKDYNEHLKEIAERLEKKKQKQLDESI